MVPNRVLLAYPEEDQLHEYRAALADAGLEVATARSGLDCVERLRSFRPNILVLDRELPWGSTEGVLAWMHEEPDLPLIPVVILSPRRNSREVRALGAFPISAYHVKPVAPRTLLDAVSGVLRKRYPHLQMSSTC